MGEKEIKERYEVIAGVWKFMKERMQAYDGTDAYWEETMRIAGEMSGEEDDFMRALLVAVLNEIVRLSKERE